MRYLMTFSYDGSKYSGYQKQNDEPSIQEEIENILTKLNSNKKVYLSASGRTDRGVHALNQKAHFDLDTDMDMLKLLHSMNSMLPDDIYVKSLEQVSENFHARFDAIGKEYIYQINMGEFNPLERKYVYQH